jgi:uncharacterized membrane protein YhhN
LAAAQLWRQVRHLPGSRNLLTAGMKDFLVAHGVAIPAFQTTEDDGRNDG